MAPLLLIRRWKMHKTDTTVTMHERPDINYVSRDVNKHHRCWSTPTDDDSTNDINTCPSKHDVPCPSTNSSADVEVIKLNDLLFIRVSLPSVNLYDLVHRTQPHGTLRQIDPMNHHLTNIAYLKQSMMSRLMWYTQPRSSVTIHLNKIAKTLRSSYQTSCLPFGYHCHWRSCTMQPYGYNWQILSTNHYYARCINTTLAIPQSTKPPIKLSPRLNTTVVLTSARQLHQPDYS